MFMVYEKPNPNSVTVDHLPFVEIVNDTPFYFFLHQLNATPTFYIQHYKPVCLTKLKLISICSSPCPCSLVTENTEETVPTLREDLNVKFCPEPVYSEAKYN